MNNVSLVSSVHAENGLASASELLKILDHLHPKVIFVEVPMASLEDYYVNCSQSNLESSAVIAYRAKNPIEIIPVDAPTPGDSFFRDNQDLFRVVEMRSYKYRQLIDQHSSDVALNGFSYLNSEACCKLWSDVYQNIQDTISELNNARLSGLFDSWKKINELRDVKMLENVRDYCSHHRFGDSVFLVGAAHRQSLSEKIRESEKLRPQINWQFPDLGN